MFTKRLFNVLVVLILGIVAFFALRVAAEAGTPGQYSSRYNQTASTDSNFPNGRLIKAGTTNYGLLFNADETFSVFEGDNTFVRATYAVEGNVFTETSNTGGCETNESFTYTFDGINLTFNYVGNPDDDAACTGRHADFNNITYTLVE